MDVVVGADGFDDTGAGGVGGFKDYLRFVEDTEDVHEVPAVEGNLDFLAFDNGVDFTDIFADFFRAGGDGELSGSRSPLASATTGRYRCRHGQK